MTLPQFEDLSLYPPNVYPPGIRRTPSIYRPGYIYLMRRGLDGAVKIGLSHKPEQRVKMVRYELRQNDIDLVITVRVASMRRTEVYLHERYKAYRVGQYGEWFLIPEWELLGLVFAFILGDKQEAEAV